MISAVLDHLWQSTLLAAAVVVLVVMFRNARASVRYGLWFVASVKFLVPFAALAALGRLLAPAIRPPAAPDAAFIARAAQPFSQSDATAVAAGTAAPLAHAAITSRASALLDPAPMLLGVWALGFAVVLIFWMARWGRIRPLLRQATPVALAAPMPVLTTPTMLEPGLVGLWRPVLLVPEALFDRLGGPGIEALVAHEACHFRRADNLTALMHMLVEALFWFHPMVWWIGGRLVDERERACDEAVVRSGYDPAVYAESLLECCRLFLQSPLRCVAGASGSNLLRRVEMIMTSPLRSSLSPSGRAVLITAGVCALASPVAAGWLTSPAERQVVSRAVAIVSAPVSVLVAQPSSAAPARERSQPAKTITVATSLAQDRPDASRRSASEPPPPMAKLEVAQVSLAPLASVKVSDAPLLRVSNQLPDAGQPLGPGHYVERSGPKRSADCSDPDAGEYAMSTHPIAPGHHIVNFRFGLRGKFRCDPYSPGQMSDGVCHLETDRPDQKTVQFYLRADTSDCYPGAGNDYGQGGGPTYSEMVFSYDVQ